MGSVLIVEPDKNQRILLKEELELDGHTTLTALSGHAALDLVSETTPDLVVIDIHMPGMDGLDLLARLHAIDNRLPVVIHTAYESYRENYLSWIADAYVLKQSDFAELKGAVRRILGKRRGCPDDQAASCLAP